MTVVIPREQTRQRIARDKYTLSPRTASDWVRSPPWHPRPAVLAGHVTATRRRWRGLTVVDRREDVRIAHERGLPEEVFHVKHRRARASITPVRGAIRATPSASGVPLEFRRAWMGFHAGPIGARAVRVRHISWTFPRRGGCSSSVCRQPRMPSVARHCRAPRHHCVSSGCFT